jgi:hypothetical protein
MTYRPDPDKWAMPPTTPMATGQVIRERKIYKPPMTSVPVRAGGAEPKVIVAETREWVIYRVWSSKGEVLGEHAMKLDEFEERFERGEIVQYLV